MDLLKTIQYRKKPVVVQAVQWNGNNYENILNYLFSTDLPNNPIRQYGNQLIIKTLEGDMTTELYDYVIKGIHGEIYPCKPEIFKKTYEPID